MTAPSCPGRPRPTLSDPAIRSKPPSPRRQVPSKSGSSSSRGRQSRRRPALQTTLDATLASDDAVPSSRLGGFGTWSRVGAVSRSRSVPPQQLRGYERPAPWTGDALPRLDSPSVLTGRSARFIPRRGRAPHRRRRSPTASHVRNRRQRARVTRRVRAGTPSRPLGTFATSA